MLPAYNYFTAALALGLAALIVYLVRRDRLSARYTMGWLVIAAAFVVFGAFPKIIDSLGEMLGVNYPPILLVILTCCFIFVKLLFMDIDRSHQERKIRALVQRLALYEAEAESREKAAEKEL